MLSAEEKILQTIGRSTGARAMVIFGASEDLTKRKLIPALYNLAKAGLLSREFALVGFARIEMNSDQFREKIKEEISQFATSEVDPEVWHWLSRRISYVQGSFDDPTAYQKLKNLLADTDREHGTRGNYFYQEMEHNDPSRLITKHGLQNTSHLCVLALDRFVSIYGAEAGNLALKAMATGGVYIGGGIAPKILPKLKESGFLVAFGAKGRLSNLLKAIPVRVILNDKTAPLGAGRLAILSQSRTRIEGTK